MTFEITSIYRAFKLDFLKAVKKNLLFLQKAQFRAIGFKETYFRHTKKQPGEKNL